VILVLTGLTLALHRVVAPWDSSALLCMSSLSQGWDQPCQRLGKHHKQE